MKVRKLDSGRKDATGQNRSTKKFYAVWVDTTGHLRKIPLFSDRGLSTEAARKIDKLDQLRATGETPGAELMRFIANMPSAMRQKLARLGIVGMQGMAAVEPLNDLLNVWASARSALGNSSPEQTREAVRSAERVFNQAGCIFWSDLTAERIAAALSQMQQDRVEGDVRVRGISPQTRNRYLGTCQQFCRWMVKSGRAISSPLESLGKINVRLDQRRVRRAFTVEEFAVFLRWTRDSDTRAKLPGAERALLYLFAVETGLRRGGIERLTVGSFDLHADPPRVLIKAGAANKYRKDRHLPLRAGILEPLTRHMHGKAAHERAFRVPPKQHSAKMIRADLLGARNAWIAEVSSPDERRRREASDFLKYTDSQGRYLDFHALRHTRGVWLVEHHKAHPREVQELLGVGSYALVERYTQSFRVDARIVERGPCLLELSGMKIAPANPAASDSSGDLKDSVVTDTKMAEHVPLAAPEVLSPMLSPSGELGRTSVDTDGIIATRVESQPPAEDRAENPKKAVDLTDLSSSRTVLSNTRRGGRAAECAGFENR